VVTFGKDTSLAALAGANFRASPKLAVLWWAMVFLRAAAPAVLTLGLGALVRAITNGDSINVPLVFVSGCFAFLSIAGPLHTQFGAILGDRTSGYLQAKLTEACTTPTGIAHLERPGLAGELVAARDFDMGMMGPPISVSMGFVAAGMVELLSGAAQAIALATVMWWAAPIVAAAWISSHVLLKGSSFWANRGDPEVQAELRHAEYSYRLAVDAAPAKELRVFGIGGWVVDRFSSRRNKLLDLQWQAMKLNQRSLSTVFVVLAAAYAVVLIPLTRSALNGDRSLASLVVAAQSLIGVSALGVGASFSWALDAAAAPVKALRRLTPRMASEGALPVPAHPAKPEGLPHDSIRFVDVGFTYPSGGAPVYERLNLTIPAGKSLAIVGRNGVGKTTLVKLLCRLYDPTSGSIQADGVDIATFEPEAWRARIAVVFQDFLRLELSLRNNVAPSAMGGFSTAVSDEVLHHALHVAAAEGLAGLDQTLSKAYAGGTDLSGGQWQRVALARALTGVSLGAGVVVLDEPTAQLDVRGEAEIFERLLEATKGCTTVLISHRFSTVRHADRIVVIEKGEVVEEGSHDELMTVGGRYKKMFDLQAARFAEGLPELDETELEVES
jgi:ATP-binding cassette, subfamily B, bacterial